MWYLVDRCILHKVKGTMNSVKTVFLAMQNFYFLVLKPSLGAGFRASTVR